MGKEYASYIAVDQKWVTQIPSHWEMKRLKGVFAMRKERNNPIQTDHILSLTAKQGVIPYAEKEGTGGNKPKDDLTQYNICRENDLLVNCMNVVSGAAGVSRYYGAISPIYYAFYPRQDENIWYYHYIFRLISFQRSLIGLGKGILMHESDEGVLTSVRMRISMNYLGNVMLPIPPREEQDQIVRFLDWKVSVINRLINLRKKQIAALEELKKAVISKAVTKGLDPNAKMKDSGVAWIGEIPEEWECVKTKSIANSIFKGNGIIKEQVVDDGDIQCVRYGEIYSKYNDSFENAISKTKISYIVNPRYISYGDILFAGTGELVEEIGKNIVYIGNEPCIAGGDIIILKHSQNPVFLNYALSCPSSQFQKSESKAKLKVVHISASEIGNIFIALPPLPEQDRIVAYLDEKTKKINEAIDKKRQQIELLKELKTRLISDVVTGKIDVRGVEIPEYEVADEEPYAGMDEENEEESEEKED